MPKLGRTIICIQCGIRKPAKGRVCDTCRGRNRGGYNRQYYLDNLDYKRNYAREHKKETLFRSKVIDILGAYCHDCGWDKERIILELHHIDSNHSNNSLDNATILCPTCHAYRHYKEKSGVYAFYINCFKHPEAVKTKIKEFVKII